VSDYTSLFLGKVIAAIGVTSLIVGLFLSAIVIFSPEAGVERADLARFLGAMFGSVVTVGGALAVFFLKEIYDAKQKLGFVGSALKNLAKRCAEATEQLESRPLEDQRSRLEFVFAEYQRTSAICRRFEFESVRISNANFWFAELERLVYIENARSEIDTMSSEKIRVFFEYLKIASESSLQAFRYRELRDWVEPL